MRRPPRVHVLFFEYRVMIANEEKGSTLPKNLVHSMVLNPKRGRQQARKSLFTLHLICGLIFELFFFTFRGPFSPYGIVVSLHSNMNHLDGLNQAQKDAVETTEGPLLVLAGAGSGKTRVITHRIIRLIEKGIDPANILAVTFTNKSAKEMRERVHALIQKYAERTTSEGQPTVSTFHALGVRLLREFHETVGLRRHFVIYDRSDSVRAIKKGLEIAGYDVKQFEPRRILSIISRAKGDAKGRDAFADSARSYPERVAAEVWEHYDKVLKEEQALDFDDLLLKTLNMLKGHPPVLETLRNRFRYIHIDEYQDTNKVQYEIARLIAGERANICVVGDVDQCLTGDTRITLADNQTKTLDKIRVGDMVQSNFGSGDFRPSRVLRVQKTPAKEPLICIETRDGRSLTSTPRHMHFAGYVLDVTPQTYMVYLMRKESFGYRIGTTQVYTRGQKISVPGFVQRSNQEHADAVWIISTYKTEKEARIAEYTLSLQYQIPTLPFSARKGSSTNGYVHDEKALRTIFSSFDTARSAEQLLADSKLSLAYPHHRPQSGKSARKNIVVTLCGDHRGKTPMHRISMAGNDPKIATLLSKHGFSVRPAKKDSTSWRFETVFASFERIQASIDVLTSIIPEAHICMQARLGTQTRVLRGKNSLPFLPAASVRPGMALFAEDGSYDVVTRVSNQKPKTTYDIDVEHTHNFIANGIVTHNSIYSWRGADITNILQFERHFPNTKIIMLEENYRSTQTIIAASNDIIEKNFNRPPKKVFTNNQEGDLISLYAAMGGQEEAEYVAMTAKNLIREGTAPSSIAVLFRTNFQSRALEEAFINYNVPYQMLGTKFFERSEIKDVLSYLRLALNPDSASDLARVINTPARGIGKVTLLKLVEGGREGLKGATAEKVNAFYRMMEEIAEYAVKNPVHETLKFIMRHTGLEDSFKHDGEEGLERIENLRELVSTATRYSAYDPEEAIEHLLEDAALQSDQDELKAKEEHDAVRLMTIHASKGLEFPYVFITGLEEGLFPHEKLGEERIDNEEERRLFYVALTRAEKKVFLSYAHIRTIFGTQRVNAPSSFLHDISQNLMESNNPEESGYERTVFLD